MVLVAPLVFRAPSGPAAREIATRELRSEWSISKPARALRTLRRPPHRRRLRCWVVMRRLEAQPGPATALGHRSQALLRPPHQWRGWNARLSLSPVGIALLGEPLHRFVASAMLRYLVHCLPK